MKLLELNINQYLFLENFPFNNPLNNIDAINIKACLSKDPNEQLNLIESAASKIEKFHSFFHFEQSYFHLQLAINKLLTGDKIEAHKQLELAIFQDHLNLQAKEMLSGASNCSNYKRVYSNFIDYLAFASEETTTECNLKPQGYWNTNNIEEIIENIRYNHLHYHQESAKLYLNRAVIFYSLGQSALAKNDIVKAHNLDNQLKSRDYYSVMIEQMGIEVVLGLGSNLGNRKDYLEKAIDKLEEMKIIKHIRRSSIRETKADLLPNSPTEWDLDYLNMAIKGITMLSPQELLKEVKNIECLLGRKGGPRWSPKEIDIDILIYGNQKIEQEDLIIPHARLLERTWALEPLLEVKPEWKSDEKN